MEFLQFPGDAQNMFLKPCGPLITMNPGDTGRQKLPETLQELFLEAAAVVPDPHIIMNVRHLGCPSMLFLADLFPFHTGAAQFRSKASTTYVDKQGRLFRLTLHVDYLLAAALTLVLSASPANTKMNETTMVTHGLMHVGSAGGNEINARRCVRAALDETMGIADEDIVFTVKAIGGQEMVEEVDPNTGEWSTGTCTAQSVLLVSLVPRT